MDYPQDVDIDGDDEDGPPPGDDSETDQVVHSLGVMRVDNNKSMYFSDAHWAAVLGDVTTPRSAIASQLLTPPSDRGSQKLFP